MAIKRFFRLLKDFRGAKKCRQAGVFPSTVLFPVIWVTHRCNLRCEMCDRWKADLAGHSDELSTREWLSFIDSASRMRAAVIGITGGEPLLREDLPGIIRYIRSKNIACHLCTNGSLLNEANVNKLKDSGLTSVSVSLYSYRAEVHNKIRGVDCFDDVVRGIGLLRQLAPRIKVGINCLVAKDNFHDLRRMLDFAQSLDVDQFKFDPVHANLAHRHKHPRGSDGRLFDKAELSELRLELAKLPLRHKLLANSRDFMKGIIDFYEGRAKRLSCYAGYVSCAVDASGRVSICDNFAGLDSIRNKPFEEIWFSQELQRMRLEARDCSTPCWDTTHAELNIRCTDYAFIRQFGQIIKDLCFYSG